MTNETSNPSRNFQTSPIVIVFPCGRPVGAGISYTDGTVRHEVRLNEWTEEEEEGTEEGE